MSQYSNQLRFILGALAIIGAANDLTTINTLSYVEQNNLKKKRILTLLKLPFTEPEEEDLVLTLSNKKYEFKIVQTTSGKYANLNKQGMRFYVPPGFLMLRNVENGQRELECYGSVVGQINFDISWTQIL